MNFYNGLVRRAANQGPVRIGVIGLGKFAREFLAQALSMETIQVLAVADRSPDQCRTSLALAGWPAERYAVATVDEALRTGGTLVAESADALLDLPALEVVLEVTGDPVAGAHHGLRAIEGGRHVVMVNVEADSLVGPVLAERARRAGLVYSMAYGDQPALITEMVDWARTAGFSVVAAGKGARYLPSYHSLTPDQVWEHFGFTPEQVETGDFNAVMFNSFLDGTKSAIEMAAVANATGLRPQAQGLSYPPGGEQDLPNICRPEADGGVLTHKGTVEVLSSLNRDGTPVPRDLRWGVYVTFEALSDYSARCLRELAVATDDTGRYGCLYRPFHFNGLELAVSVAAAVVAGEPTGVQREFLGDVVAVAKRDLGPGEELDGEGGHCVYGELMCATDSLAMQALPMGLARGLTVSRPVKRGQIVRRGDVVAVPSSAAARLRDELESLALTQA